MKKVTRTYLISYDIARKVAVHCAQNDVSKSDLIENALMAYFAGLASAPAKTDLESKF